MRHALGKAPAMSIQRLSALLSLVASLAAAAAHGEEALTAPPRPVVAVVLSGGAALGFAHVGVLKVIQELGIPVDIVVGASMGAIVGGLYAAGYSPSDMERISQGEDWQTAFDDALSESPYSFREREVSRRYPFTLDINGGKLWADSGLFGAQSVTTILEMLTLKVSTVSDFDALPRRFRAVAADISTGEEVVLGRGSLADAMRASATIPLLFTPFVLDGRALVDGGIVNRLPTDIARDMGAEIIIAVEVRESPVRTGVEPRTLVEMFGQVSSVLLEQNTAPRRALADLVISPDMTGFRRTDFFKAPGIIRQGEAQARLWTRDLEAIAARIARSRPREFPGTREGSYADLPVPVPRMLVVRGASAENEQAARRPFSPLLGAPLDPARLQAALSSAYRTGRFEEVRVGMSLRDDVTSLVVTVVPVAPARASALLGLRYEGDVSETLANSLVLTPGIMIRDLTGKGSQLIVDASIVDTLGVGAEYFQPLGAGLFLDGYGDYLVDRDLFLQNDTARVGRLELGPTGGAWGGVALGAMGEAKAGLEWSARHYLDPTLPAAVDSTASVARFLLALDTRPARVFPSRGFGLTLAYDQALPALGGTETYRKLSLDAEAVFPLIRNVALGLTFSGGTDFTFSGTSPGALGPADAFSLRSESQFRGYQEWDIRGSHKLAAGMDLQVRLAGLNRLIGADLYLLGNASAGNCWTDLPQLAQPFSLHYGGSLGIGARIQPDFLVSSRVCWVDSGRLQLSVDLGPIAVDDAAGLIP
jgi:NTE family protein